LLRRAGSYLRQHHIAFLALFLALGGTSYAAIKLPANSVGSKQIKNKAVTPKKVSPAAVKLFRGKRGARGATGAPGPTGLTGPQGPAGPSNGTAYGFASSSVPAGIATTEAPVLSLPGAGLVTTFSAGLVATATITITQTANGAAAAGCRLSFQGEAQPEVIQRVTFSGVAGDFQEVSLTGATSPRIGGTYDVDVICASTGAGTLGFHAGALTVHAVAAG